MTRTLPIGQLSKATDVPAKTIRYYEEIKLLPKPKRSSNGYRHYSERDAHVLRFIKRSRDLGFSVETVRSLVALWGNQRRESRRVKELAREHLEEIETKIQELEGLKATLSELIDHCHGDERPNCPILEDLAGKSDGW